MTEIDTNKALVRRFYEESTRATSKCSTCSSRKTTSITIRRRFRGSDQASKV
jgi:hypothetical protein